jgi:hypothetical protein
MLESHAHGLFTPKAHLNAQKNYNLQFFVAFVDFLVKVHDTTNHDLLLKILLLSRLQYPAVPMWIKRAAT